MPLDARRLVPSDDATHVTATQIREVFQYRRAADQHQPGDPEILVIMDAGYEVARLACWPMCR